MNEKVKLKVKKVFPIIFDNDIMIYPNDDSKHLLIMHSWGSLSLLKTKIIKSNE